MSLNKLIVIFGIILTIFAGVIFFQFSPKLNKNSATPTATVTINKHTFKIEVAENPKEQEMGLSGRSSMHTDQGMLFVFENLDYYSFWMKNMKFPLDILFIKDNKIVSIAENAQPPLSENVNPPLLKPNSPINKVLEINAGLTNKYGIKNGDSVEIKTSN